MYAIYRNAVEQTQFGRFETAQDAQCALMRSGVAGYLLGEFEVRACG